MIDDAITPRNASLKSILKVRRQLHKERTDKQIEAQGHKKGQRNDIDKGHRLEKSGHEFIGSG